MLIISKFITDTIGVFRLTCVRGARPGYLWIITAGIVFVSCISNDDETSTDFWYGQNTMGYKPVYGDEKTDTIPFTEAKPLKNPGKIYRYGQYLLVNERYEGIHVIDNRNPAAPAVLGFLTIPGNVDMALKGNLLFADRLGNLVTIDITDLQHPTVVDRIADLYGSVISNHHVPPEGSYFECVDPEREHMITAWIFTSLNDPKCYR